MVARLPLERSMADILKKEARARPFRSRSWEAGAEVDPFKGKRSMERPRENGGHVVSCRVRTLDDRE